MDAIGAQDVRAFEALYDRYARLVYSTAYGVLEDAQSAEDVVQEVLTRLWKAPQRYVPARGKFFSWLLSVTRNLAIDQYRVRRRRTRNARWCERRWGRCRRSSARRSRWPITRA